ncbi:MAG: multiheme c-type cytochrome [Leptospira bouyouniensis]|uniref:Cytochrome c554 and C-prime n=1 Tax=Leptospira bouyouniensis TaxID=2484911 RepID=A0A7I0IPC1_9LEPT|nr:multiheme c-type cytochrome [Leptospira bouyouniensis]TGL06430.1 cytochrome c554 and C-prime [Leptospira bouyouniensis]
MRSQFLQLTFWIYFVFQSVSCKENSFLSEHWNHPLPIQTNPDVYITESESNYNPDQCANCHMNQYKGWKTSFHAKSIGNGLLWQKAILSKDELNSCLHCHSPLPETKSEVSDTYQNKEILGSKNKHFPEGISNPSIQCASCHIRNQIWYGPPSTKQSNNQIESLGIRMPHNGYKVQMEFESSSFCKSCHESPKSGQKLNGKNLMEVYKEWEESSYSKNGIQCQNCHMPNREHTWKGIHDPEFVRGGLQPIWSLTRTLNGEIQINAELKSIAIGHKFPTYLIPKVYLRFFVTNRIGQRKLIEESIVGRLVNTNLTEEYFDTRITPGNSHVVSVRIADKEKEIKTIDWVIEVDPDEHYIRSFEESLREKSNSISETTKKLLQLSLSEKRESRYILFTSSLPVPVSLPK